jgi:hypothetical protein
MKGQYQQECDRTACSNGNAIWYNKNARGYYCQQCAELINKQYKEQIDFVAPVLTDTTLFFTDFFMEKKPYFKLIGSGHRTDYKYVPERNEYLGCQQYNIYGPALVFGSIPMNDTELEESTAETFEENFRIVLNEMNSIIPITDERT